MTLQLLHSEFPYIWEKFDFLFYQCTQSPILIVSVTSGTFSIRIGLYLPLCIRLKNKGEETIQDRALDKEEEKYKWGTRF